MKNLNKKYILTILAILLIFAKGNSQEVLDKIVAVVEDNIILKSELQQFAYSFAIQNKIDPMKEQDKFNAVLQKTLDDIPMRRGGKADEIAGLAILLASDASSYISVQIFVEDGGRSIKH